MASLALDPAYRRVSVDEFLAMDFHGAKAELDDGIIYMMTGGNRAHSRISANLIVAFGNRLKGTGCAPYDANFGCRTGEQSVRYPDVSTYCDHPTAQANDFEKLIGEPQVVLEVLSPSTSSFDQKVKLAEYQALAHIREIVFVDPSRDRVRLVRRSELQGWTDTWLSEGQPLELASLSVTIPHPEIFARD